MADELKEKQLYGLYIPPEAWHSNITTLAKVLYGRLCSLPSFNAIGSFASRAWMAEEIGASEQRITQLIKILIDAELIISNGWHTNGNGKRTRLLLRNAIDLTYNKLLPKNLANNKLLPKTDLANNKLLPNTRVKDNIKSNPLFSFSGNWRESEYKDKFDFIHSNNPKIDSVHLRYAIEYQEKKLEKYASFFKSKKSYSDPILINQIIKSCDVIDKLIRIDKHYFRETIVPVLKWAGKDKFWNDKVLSLSGLREKGKNGQTHFNNLHKDWCKAEEIDPRKGRYVLESEVIRTPAVNPKWTEYLNAKRKEQGIGAEAVPEGLSQEGFEEFFKQKGTVTI